MEFGKFNDAISLFEGYVNLEKAYTKKCQEANNLKRQLSEQSVLVSGVDALNRENGQDEVVGGDENKNSMAVKGFVQNCEQESADVMPTNGVKSDADKGEIYDTKSGEIGLNESEKSNEDLVENSCYERFKRPEWRKSVAKFFAEVPEAKLLKREIANIILHDKELQNDDNCLQIAYERITKNRPASVGEEIAESEQPLKQKAHEEDFDPNKEITLSEYLQLVAERKVSAPKFLVEMTGGRSIGLTPQKKISSIAEAGDYLMKNYFR